MGCHISSTYFSKFLSLKDRRYYYKYFSGIPPFLPRISTTSRHDRRKKKSAQSAMLDYVGFLLMVAACLLNSSAGQRPFTVTVAQKIYQVEEQKNITMTWFFATDHDGPPPPLYIDLRHSPPSQSIYEYDSRLEAEPYVHHNYSGRLRCSQFTSRGQVDCSIAHLKPSDSGTYVCIITAGKKSNSSRCDVTVTAVQGQPEDEEPKPTSRGRIPLLCSFCLVTVVIVALIICSFTCNTSH